jgi:hypothetical protein
VGRAGGPGDALSPRQILWRPRKQQATRGWRRGQSHKMVRRQGVKRGPRRGPVAISAQGRRRGLQYRRTSRLRRSLLLIVPTCPARPSVFSASWLSIPKGSPSPCELRYAIVRGILFLATPHQRWPYGPLMALRSRGAAFPTFTFGSLQSPLPLQPPSRTPATHHTSAHSLTRPAHLRAPDGCKMPVIILAVPSPSSSPIPLHRQ